MDPAGRWGELAARPEGQVPLDEAATLISAVAHPGLDVAAVLGRLDALAARVGGSDVASVCRLLFDEEGLAGDRERYDDPVNSYLDQVLVRRRGIPITLSVVVIEVARRCGVTLEAVGMPGHVLVRDPGDPEALIDAFDGGARLGPGGCARLLRAVAGPGARLDAAMLASVGTRAVLARMLANLDRSFAARRDLASVAWVCDLRAALPGTSVADRVQLAGRQAELGRFGVAAATLEGAASGLPAGPVRARLDADALDLRARLN